MKKNLVLGSLFILPIVAYLFFASGIYNFAHLPVITTGVDEVAPFTLSEIKQDNAATTPLRFKDHITLLAYVGDQLKANIGYTANINLTIYKYFQEYEEFQMVCIVGSNNEAQIANLKTELSRVTDVSKFRFVALDREDAQTHFESLQAPFGLGSDGSSPFVFVIDREGSMRSRNDDAKKQNNFGYDLTQPVEMGYLKDDIKILLAEYRRALKKNNNASPELEYRPQ